MPTDVLDLDGNPLVTIPASSFTGYEFDNIPLRRADFRGQDLTGCTFQHCDLTGASFNGADLSGGDLVSAILNRTDLTGCNVSGTVMNDTAFMHVPTLYLVQNLSEAVIGGPCHLDRTTLVYNLPQLNDTVMEAFGYTSGEVAALRGIWDL